MVAHDYCRLERLEIELISQICRSPEHSPFSSRKMARIKPRCSMIIDRDLPHQTHCEVYYRLSVRPRSQHELTCWQPNRQREAAPTGGGGKPVGSSRPGNT